MRVPNFLFGVALQVRSSVSEEAIHGGELLGDEQSRSNVLGSRGGAAADAAAAHLRGGSLNHADGLAFGTEKPETLDAGARGWQQGMAAQMATDGDSSSRGEDLRREDPQEAWLLNPSHKAKAQQPAVADAGAAADPGADQRCVIFGREQHWGHMPLVQAAHVVAQLPQGDAFELSNRHLLKDVESYAPMYIVQVQTADGDVPADAAGRLQPGPARCRCCWRLCCSGSQVGVALGLQTSGCLLHYVTAPVHAEKS